MEICIGRILTENRHKRGITQDELAEYIGVSKAAVSKWETSATYPDIKLLPHLAAYFNLTIDELMGYEPQMTKEQIRKLHNRLSEEFNSCPLEDVLGECRELVKKYYSCFPLLFQIASLFVNHCQMVGSQQKTEELLEEAKALFVRVKAGTEDMELKKQALNMEALCLLSLNHPEEVLDILENSGSIITFKEPLLASAYQMVGNPRAGKRILQVGMYQILVGLHSLLNNYMYLCRDDPEAFKQSCRRLTALGEGFDLESLHPSIMLSFYATAAGGFLEMGDKENAYRYLEKYTDLAVGNIYPLRLHGDSYFNLLDEWIEDTLDLGSDLPREEGAVRRSVIETVTKNPLFTSLSSEQRFQEIVCKLEKEKGESGKQEPEKKKCGYSLTGETGKSKAERGK